MKKLTTQRRRRGFRVFILSVTILNPWWASTISTMVIAPSKKNTISLTSADAWDSSETAISVDGAYRQFIKNKSKWQWKIESNDTWETISVRSEATLTVRSEATSFPQYHGFLQHIMCVGSNQFLGKTTNE
jgi:hypothetical protein